MLRRSVRRGPIPPLNHRGVEHAEARWLNVFAVGGLVAVVALYLLHCGSFWHYLNDDAYITFRYSRFLATGRGPYFNPGEHVEGYTNFLLMLLLAPVYRLGGPAALPVVARSIGVASGAASLVLVAWLARELLAAQGLRRSLAACVGVGAAALVAAAPGYAVNSTSGLATILFGFLLTLGVVLAFRAARRDRWCGSGIAFGALALTRPEGAFVFGVAWIAQAVGLRDALRSATGLGIRGALRSSPALRRLLLDAAIVTGVFAAHLAFRLLAYDGEWLPNTYYAKAGGFWKVDAWKYVRDGIFASFLGVPGVLLALPGVALTLRRVPAARVPAVVALTGALLPFVTGTDWMVGWRLLTPYLPLAACVVAVGWAVAILYVAGARPWLAPIAVAAAAAAVGFLQLPTHARIASFVSIRNAGYVTGHRALAEWLCEAGGARPGDTIALMDIGLVGYLCDGHPILDISGLTDRHIAKREGEFLHKEYDPAYVFDREPRFVVLTFTAKGWYYQPPPRDTRFTPWTRIEGRLFQAPEFQTRYRLPATAEPEAGLGWQERLARRLGAVRIFEHAYPEAYYLLAVFDAEAGRPGER